MLESLLFMLLIFFGGLCLIASSIFFLIGLISKSSALKKAAFGTGILSVFFFGIIFFWYSVVVPLSNKSEMNNYSGSYSIESNNNVIEKSKVELTLFSDWTYKFSGNKNIRLSNNGTWETGGIDGQFEFYDDKKSLIGFASQFNENGNKRIIFNLYRDNEVRFIKKD